MQARAQESEIELELAAQAGSWKGLEASIQAEAESNGSNFMVVWGSCA